MDDHRHRIIDRRISLVNNNDPSVTEVSLFGAMTEDQIRALFRGLEKNTHVRKLGLYLTPRELRRTVCQQLLPPVLEENSSIEYLRFPKDMTNADFLPNMEVLCNINNTTMKTLDLDGCDIRGRDGGEMIGRLIRSNHITTIDLKWNTRLGPSSAMQIAAALGDDDCALKTLDLAWCGIGDKGTAALSTALHVNNSLETFRFYRSKITDKGYRTLARSLPRMSGLKEICFRWEPPQVSAAMLQQMMDSLHKNRSLQRIAVDAGNLSEEQHREWETCCAFVCARNKMNSHLLEEVRDAARDGRVAPVPIPIGPLLWWCRHHEDAEVQDSLVFHLLHSNPDEILGLADTAGENG